MQPFERLSLAAYRKFSARCAWNPIFGDAVLPADQTVPPGDATGTQLPPGSGPRVVVSGWQVYDNKGRVVEKYEPFFSVGWDYAPPANAQFGQKVTMYYDPRGKAVHTVNPDGSEQRVIYGVPGSRSTPDLKNPDVFEPTPWEVYTYDANDNAGRTHPTTSVSYQSHWNTPASIVVDALGRAMETVDRNGADPTTEWYVTLSTYDIQGNLLSVTDPLGRLAFQHVYDLAKHMLRFESIDAGVRRNVLDAAGDLIEHRDSKGALFLSAYDVLNRPVKLWARDGTAQAITLREYLVYGDGPDSGFTRPQAAAVNLLGQLFRHYDEAGLLTLEYYDFKGNLLEKTRQVISDATILAVFNPPPTNWQVQAFRVDWQPPGGMTVDSYAATVLDVAVYQTSTAYDALNRVRTILYPQDVTGTRKTLTPQYNRRGALEPVDLDGTTYVDRIAYDAKGQRSLIAYGNGVMTRYAYDLQTFRLAHMRTEPYTTPAALIYHPQGAPLQDLAYAYDLIGNMLGLSDRTPGSGIPNTVLGTDALDRAFSYDPIYRLLTATGRECSILPPPPPWDDTLRCTDMKLTRPYVETCTYDPVGNLTQLGHSSGPTRTFAQVTGTNRLASMAVGTTNFAYSCDDNGNLLQENTARHFEWDYSDRMRVYRTQPGSAEPSVHAFYLYDAGGQRVKKLVRKQGGRFEVTIYVDGLFEYQRIVQGRTRRENNTLHVMDGKNRIALVRVGSPFPDDATPPAKYYLADHLGSSNVVIDGTAGLVNREEYTPYGETSFGSFARKRYRFTGKERDEESGLYYHGARYYAPWIGRWTSCDPKGVAVATNLFTYSHNNPVRFFDPDGNDPKELPWYQKAWIAADEALQQFRAATSRGVALSDAAKGESGPGILAQAKLRYEVYTHGPVPESGPATALHILNDTLNPFARAKQAADRAEQADRAGDQGAYIRGKVQEAASLVGAAILIRDLAKPVEADTAAGRYGGNAQPSAGARISTKSFVSKGINYELTGEFKKLAATNKPGELLGQVYVVRNAKGEMIYVGSTGRGEKTVRDAFTRLKDHLENQPGEWLGSASKLEIVGKGLSEREALALEQDLIQSNPSTHEFNTDQHPYEQKYGRGEQPNPETVQKAHNTRIQFDIRFSGK